MQTTEIQNPVPQVIEGALQPAAAADLLSAFAKAVSRVQNPQKSALNPHFKSNYANLADVLAVVRPALLEQSLTVVQTTATVYHKEELALQLTTHIFSLATGASIPMSVLLIGPDQLRTPPMLGSAVTYYRRYALLALFSIYGDDDEDGAVPGQKHDTPGPAALAAALKEIQQAKSAAEVKTLVSVAMPNVTPSDRLALLNAQKDKLLELQPAKPPEVAKPAEPALQKPPAP